jgi:Uma2 family endonuclease
MATIAEQPLTTPAPPYWTLADYHAAADAGVFGARRVELIRGALYEMPPMSEPHAGATRYLAERFYKGLPDGRVLSQTPVILPRDSEPEPDVAVTASGTPAKPSAAQLQLVVEVSRSTRGFDRGTKLEMYLADDVPEVWLIDLVERCALVYRSGVLYARHAQAAGAQLQAERVPEVTIDLDAVFRAAGFAASEEPAF